MCLKTISRGDLEEQLATIRALAPGGAEGLFGPASVTWRVDREAAIFLGAGRAIVGVNVNLQQEGSALTPAFSHSRSFDHRRRPETLRTAIAMAFFWPTHTTSLFPRVMPV